MMSSSSTTLYKSAILQDDDSQKRLPPILASAPTATTPDIAHVESTAARPSTPAMAFHPIEDARPPEGPGWGRAFYEPSPFDRTGASSGTGAGAPTPGPARRAVVHVGQETAAAMGVAPWTWMGGRRAEAESGMMVLPDSGIDVVGLPAAAPAQSQPEPIRHGSGRDDDGGPATSLLAPGASASASALPALPEL